MVNEVGSNGGWCMMEWVMYVVVYRWCMRVVVVNEVGSGGGRYYVVVVMWEVAVV